MYFCAENGLTAKNTPAPADSFSLFVEKTGAWGTGIKQTFTHFATGETCQRVLGYDTSGTKGPWVTLATATPPQEYGLPLAEGLIQSSASWYNMDQFNQVHVHGAISAGSSGSLGWDTLVATLPEGYRPSVKIEAAATFDSDGTSGCGAVAVSEDGTIKAFPDISATKKVVYFDVVFLATSK